MAKATSSKKEIAFSEQIGLSQPEPAKDLHQSVTELEEENRTIRHTLSKMEEESAMLRELFSRASNELNNIKKPALLVADVINVVKDKAIIRLPNGNKFYSYISKDVGDVHTADSVLIDQKSLNIIGRVEFSDMDVEKLIIVNKPKETWSDIGGLDKEIQEIKEVIELPLTKPELFEKVGIKPPKGVLLYGPPGTGKTLLARAVANSTHATFIEVVGSELVQKFIGEGAKLVKDMFVLARKKSPSIIFIDEIDALAAMRMDTGMSGEREVNRTFMQLLAELDGFEHLDNVKVICATNRADILDQALLRPGRLDRLIEVHLPDEAGRREIMKVHTQNMNFKGVKMKDLIKLIDGFSGAEIRASCTEAGYCAIRENRDYVKQRDFIEAIEKIRLTEEDDTTEDLFG